MMKRMLLSLAVVVLLFAAGDADAQSCERCRPVLNDCVYYVSVGGLICDFDPETDRCFTSGTCDGLQARVAAPLAAEFAVASVERLDEPSASQDTTLVASAETRK